MQVINEIILPTSSIQKEDFKAKIKWAIEEGELNPLEFYRRAKLIDDCIEELKKDPEIFSAAQQERSLWGKEKPVIGGSVIDTSSRTTYDYSTCNDPVLNDLEEKVKQRKKMLQSLPSTGMADPENGNIIYPPTAKISEFITVKI